MKYTSLTIIGWACSMFKVLNQGDETIEEGEKRFANLQWLLKSEYFQPSPNHTKRDFTTNGALQFNNLYIKHEGTYYFSITLWYQNNISLKPRE